MKTVVLYPGRFQPMLPHHAEVYRHLQSEFPDAEVHIVTADKVEAGRSPFTADEKRQIMMQQHGIPEDRIIINNQLYNWKAYENTFDLSNTKLIFAVGGKDMEGNPRFSFKPKKDGSASYLQMINTTSDHALPGDQRGYVYSAPTIGDENEAASASAFRQALLTAPDLDSAKDVFTKTMGEFNQGIFDLVYDKITGNIMKESLETLKKLAGLLDEAPVNFAPGKGNMDYEPGVSSKDQKNAAERPEKAASSNPNSVGFTDIGPEDMISVDTGKPINSKQRAKSMANQFPDGADINDPAVKKEQFLKVLARSPGYVLGEINARLANDDEGFAASDRLSNIIDRLPEDGVMGLGDEDRKWTLSLVNNAINNMVLHKKDPDLDNFDDEPHEFQAGIDSLDNEEPEMVSLDDPEYDSQPDDDELEMEETNDLNDLRQMAGLERQEAGDIAEVEANEFEKTIAVNQSVELAGDSIWDKEGTKNPNSIEVKDIVVHAPFDVEDDDLYMEVSVNHNGPWTIYTDTGFEKTISKLVGFKVKFTEQGMQEEGVASLGGYSDDTAVAEDIARMRHLAGLERQEVSEGGECYHCDGTGVHQDEDGENYDCEKCNGSGYVGASDDDQDEPGQDEIDAHAEPVYKKYINNDQDESLDLSSVVESIIGEKRIDELNFSKIKNLIMQKVASKFGKGEHDTIEKRITTSYKNAGEGEYDSYITVDGEKTYGPFSGIEDFANAMTKISNSLIMNKDTSKFSHKVLKPLDPETGHAFQDPKFQQSVRDLGSKLNKADVDALPVKKESAPEQQNSEMSDEELHAYVGQKEEDLVQDMIYHFAPDYVGKDNFEERYERYREEVLLPAAQDVSAEKNADDMAGTDYDSDDFVDNYNMVGDDEINQEESLDELDSTPQDPDGNGYDAEDAARWKLTDTHSGKEYRAGSILTMVHPPATILAIIPPTASTEGAISTSNRTISRREYEALGLKMSQSRQRPSQGELALPKPDPHQPNLPGMAGVVKKLEPETTEGLDLAIDNALAETVAELRKLAGL